MQPALVFQYLVDDPGCRTPADDTHDVLSRRRPSVPEMLQCRDETRFGRVHPRHFVDEHDFPPLRAVLDDRLEFVKGVNPVAEMRTLQIPPFLERTAKGL